MNAAENYIFIISPTDIKFQYTFYPIQQSELNKMQFCVSAAIVQTVETHETSVALESV
jgi:hypothetical protein